MKISVLRKDPDKSNDSYIQEYEVPVDKNEKWTVMDVLDYIALHLDGGLSYYRHSICDQGICARCSVRVNGQVRLACTYVVTEDELILEPANNKVLKDLVVKPQ